MTPEWAAIIVAALTSISAISVGLLNRSKLGAIHLDLNSRLDAALAAQYQLGKAAGRKEGVRERSRTPNETEP